MLHQLPMSVGKFTVTKFLPHNGRYKAVCAECGAAMSFSKREVTTGRVPPCPRCSEEASSYKLIPGERIGAVVIVGVEADALRIRCDRCLTESFTDPKVLMTRERFMHGETDCGCSKIDREVREAQEAEKRRVFRKQVAEIKKKAREQSKVRRDLSGRVIGHWVILRAATKKEALLGAGTGRKWVVMCICGDKRQYIKSTSLITAQKEHCIACQVRVKKPKKGSSTR